MPLLETSVAWRREVPSRAGAPMMMMGSPSFTVSRFQPAVARAFGEARNACTGEPWGPGEVGFTLTKL